MQKKMIDIAISDAYADRFNVHKSQVDMSLNDADDAIAFMVSQLAHLEPKLYEVKYANIVFEELVPIDTSINEAAQTVNYRSFDGVTMGKFIGANADDLPTVAQNMQLHTVLLGYAGAATRYSLDELRTSAFLGQPIDQTQARLAFRGAKEHQQKIVLYGDADRGMGGLLNHENVTKTTSSTDWNTATADKILEDVNNFLSDIWVDSNQAFMPNTLLIDTKRFTKIATTRLNDVTSQTILEFIKENNIAKLQGGIDLDIRALPQLMGAQMKALGGQTNAYDRMVAYEKNPENLVAYMPIAPRFVAPQYEGLTVVTPMEYKISGTEFRYPGCAAYCDFSVAMS